MLAKESPPDIRFVASANQSQTFCRLLEETVDVKLAVKGLTVANCRVAGADDEQST